MPSQHDAGLLGDWSGFRGAEYHLAYALWLLLTERIKWIRFYDGNDLRAAMPPELTGANQDDVVELQGVGREDADIWFQFKASEKPWTVRELLEKNLLINFMLNALESREAGQEYEVRLISQAKVRRSKVLEFVADPTRDPGQADRLNEIVARVDRQWRQHRPQARVAAQVELRQLAVELLTKLAKTQPVKLDKVQRDIVEHLRSEYYDEDLAGDIANSLRGALLRDVSMRPDSAAGNVQTYDAAWLSEVSAYRKKAIGPVLSDPPLACQQAIDRAVPDDWDPARYTSRPVLEEQLQDFLRAEHAVFVLLGNSGSGKSWTVTNWCVRTLDGRIRLLVGGDDFSRFRDLAPMLENCVGPLKERSWNDQHFVDWFTTEATRLGAGPPVLVLDDLKVGIDSLDSRRALSRLVRQCRERGIKLVVTCQEQVWITNDLGRDVPVHDLFMPALSGFSTTASPDDSWVNEQTMLLSSDTNSRQNDARATYRYSARLADLESGELRGILDRRLPHDVARKLARQFKDPLYVLLRNPYLLTLYLTSYRGAEVGKDAPTVDALLDQRLHDLLRPLAQELNWSVADVEEALDPMWEALWSERHGRIPSHAAAGILNVVFPDRGEVVLSALRQSGVLTVSAPVAFAETLVGERLFARRLVTRFAEGDADGLTEGLRPSVDVGTVLALLRGAVTEPARVAQTLIAHDTAWLSTVTAGLAQGAAEDYSVLALLSVLARPRPPQLVAGDACESLGRLAVRGRRARQWVEGMYLSDRPVDRLRGERALRATMRLAPDIAGEIVRTRLDVASTIPAFHGSDREKRSKWLDGALDPLIGVRDEAGAQVVSKILGDLPASLRSDPALRQDMHEVRGAAVLEAGENDVEHVLKQLKSEDTQERIDAAEMLRTIVPERPEAAQFAITCSIREEQDEKVLLRVMWAAYHIIDVAAEDLLSAIESRRWFEMPDPSLAVALALALAGDLASRFPHRVFAFLSRDLNKCEPQRRALLSEIFAYAWWQCSVYVPAGREVLEALVEPGLVDVPDEFRIFGMRGAAIAQLGLLCIENDVAGGVDGHQGPIYGENLTSLCIYAERFVERHAHLFVNSNVLQPMLVACVKEEDRVKTVLPWSWLAHARWHCAALCADILVGIACTAEDSLAALRALPEDELALPATRRLLDEGRRDEELLAFARELCARTSESSRSLEAALERSHCLAHLAAADTNPVYALRDYLESVKYQLGEDHRGIGFASVIDEHLDHLFSLVEEAMQEPDDLPLLYLLEDHARSWQAHLIGRVYARMFDARPIDVDEARELCGQMITAIEALPASPLQHEYNLVYGAISARLSSRVPYPLPESRSATIFGRSHILAMELLVEQNPYRFDQGISWLASAVTEVRGWWETGTYTLSEGNFGRGSGNHLMYPFPAVRLAAIAVGSAYEEYDVSAVWMKERADGHLVLKHPYYVLAWKFQRDPDQWDSMITELREFTERVPRHAEAWCVLGDFLVRRRRLDEAEQCLRACLALQSCGHDTAASAWYDLACTYALRDCEEECVKALVTSDELRPIDRSSLQQDEDLGTMRERTWFREFVGQSTS